MNAVESIKRKIRKLWSQAPSLASSELLQLYHSNPRLDGARIIATKCASTELYLYNREDLRKNKNNAEIIADHAIYELLENPCPTFRELTGWHIRYFVFACYVLVGEAYLLKIRSPNGKIISLSPIAPSWVVKTPTAGAEYWEIYPYGTTGGNSIVVPANDVICFRDINLADPYGRGRGTAETIGDEVQSDEYASKYEKNLFFNDATPSAIIYAPQGNKETADQIKQSWLQKMAGYHHAKEPMVLTGEGSKFEKISQSPTELDFVESRKFLRDSALQQFHIPPEITGILENSNRSTIDSAFYLLNKNVLSDYLRMYERVMNTQLLWEDYDTGRALTFRHENTIEEDTAQKLQIVNDGLSRGTLTVNDWRIAMGFEPDERGGDVYLRTFSTVPVQFNSNDVELPDVTEEETQEEITLPEESPEAEQEAEPKEKAYRSKYKTLDTEADIIRRKALWKEFDARAKSIEEPFKKSMGKAFDKQSEIVDKTIKEAVDNNKDVGTAIETIYNNTMDDQLKHTLASAFFTGLNVGAENGSVILGMTGYRISDEVKKLFNLWIDSHGLELCKDMNDTTKKRLRKVLAEAIEEGDGLAERKKKLIAAADGFFADEKKWRAELIARTESCSTMNAGAMTLYQTEGITQKEWISVQDDRTRDSHWMMDGVVIPIEEKFEVPETAETEGAWMEYPGDPSAPVGQVANCRCTISPYVG